MTPAVFAQLLTPAGQATLAAAQALAPTLAGYPAALDRLSKTAPREVARAALDTVLLRAKATAKFEHAERLYFTRPGLEMASGTLAARHRASRFREFACVADLTSGIGGDTVELAAVTRVVAFDRDEFHTALTAANLAALGRSGRASVADALVAPLENVTAAVADPGRRTASGRTLGLEAGEPPVSAICARFGRDFPLAIKAAPGVPHADLIPLDAEAEFVSVGGELKECVVWFGPLRTMAWRATVLPANTSLVGDPHIRPPLGPVGAVIFDPDPAITRSGLVGELARRLNAHALDAAGAFLSGAKSIPTPFATNYAVEAVLPLKPRAVGEYLRARGVGRVTPVKRGVDVDTPALVAGWKLRGSEHRAVLFLKVQGVPTAVIGERVEPGLLDASEPGYTSAPPT